MVDSAAHLVESPLGVELGGIPSRRTLAYRPCALCSPAVAADIALVINAVAITLLAVLTQATYYTFFLESMVQVDDYTVIGLAVGLIYFLTARFADLVKDMVQADLASLCRERASGRLIYEGAE